MSGPVGTHVGALRLVVLTASVTSLVTLMAAGLLPVQVAAGAAALFGGACALSAWAVSRAARRWRHAASGVLIVTAGLLMLASIGMGRDEPPGPGLTLVLVAVMVIHALGLEDVRLSLIHI